MTTNMNTTNRSNNYVSPNSPLGDINGWVYGNGAYTYRMQGAQRKVEIADVGEELLFFYAKWMKYVLIIGGAFFLIGMPEIMATALVVMALSTIVVIPYQFVKVANRFRIYELN